ncbi:hypothetical protein COLO4_08772 [Corchorus olitorius]|uniref:RRM domain-containing protein n=1 Tax=Corchorus olitorius TaxID=93759 RepID=A0A1R3KEU4_9ROSI|nr:hypothetical protein COLO4_08772 [Corchorus olitorius]
MLKGGGTRRGERGRFQSGFRQSTESFRWRLSLHSAFVSNISFRASKRDLWEFFNQYGVVVDVFLPARKKDGVSCFAFVRYRFEDELNSAVKRGFGQILLGRSIVVRKATARKIDMDINRGEKRDPRHQVIHRPVRYNLVRNSRSVVRNNNRKHPVNKGRSPFWKGVQPFDGGNRLSRDISPHLKLHATGKNQSHNPIISDNMVNVVSGENGVDDVLGTANIVNHNGGTQLAANEIEEGEVCSDESYCDVRFREDVFLEVNIPKEDMSWLDRSVVVVFNGDGNIFEVKNLIFSVVPYVQIRELSNILLLLTVNDPSLIDDCISKVKNLNLNSISSVELWNSSSIKKCQWCALV